MIFVFLFYRQTKFMRQNTRDIYDLGNHRSAMWFSTLLTFGTCFIIVNLIKFKINFISHYFSVHLVKRELNCAMEMPVKTRVIANCTVFVSIFLLNAFFLVHRKYSFAHWKFQPIEMQRYRIFQYFWNRDDRHSQLKSDWVMQTKIYHADFENYSKLFASIDLILEMNWTVFACSSITKIDRLEIVEWIRLQVNGVVFFLTKLR